MLKIVSSPKQVKSSDLYTVYARQNEGEWLPIDVYLALAPNGISNWIKLSDEAFKEFDGLDHGTVAVKTYLANFSFEGTVEVKIRFNGEVSFFNVKPRNFVDFIQNGNEITFSIDKPSKLSIEPNGDIFGSLHLFCEAPEVFDNDSYNKVIYFEKGFHTFENNENIILNKDSVPIIKGITDNTLIYAEQGAVVCAAIEIFSASHIKVDGLGTFSLLDRCYGAEKGFDLPVLYGGFREKALPSVYIHGGCDDIIIKNSTFICEFRGICARNASAIIIDNVKIFSSAVNGDGINYANICHSEIKNCYIQSSDDSLAFFTSADSITTLWDTPSLTRLPKTADIDIHNCCLWTNARIFMVGGHATCNKEPRDIIENIRFYDCEVFADASNINGQTYQHRLYWSGIFRVLSQSEAIVKNISFENITVNWTKGFNGKPFHIEVRGNTASYSESGGYRVEKISFKNIHFYDVPQEYVPTYIKSVEYDDRNYCVSDVVFSNITFNGVPLLKSNMLTEGNVENITIE